MNSTLTTSVVTPTITPVVCATASFSQFPTTDVACAVGSTSGVPANISSVLQKCCKTSPLSTFNQNCGFYCTSVQQTVAELQKCFVESSGVAPANVFCNAKGNATASGTPRSMVTPTSAMPSTAMSTGMAARIGGMGEGVSTMGLSVLGMVLVSTFVGAIL